MFSSSMYGESGLAELREKQKSASKQYREKQKMMQQEKSMEFEQIRDANYRLSAENALLKSDVTEKFSIIAANTTEVRSELHQLSSFIRGDKLTPAALSSFTQDAGSDAQQQQNRSVIVMDPRQRESGLRTTENKPERFDAIPEQQIYYPLDYEEDSPDYTSGLSNHGFLFAFVLLIVFVLPMVLFPAAPGASGVKKSSLRLVQVGSIRRESNLEPFQMGFHARENADPDANALRLAGGFPTLDLDQFCRTACKGQIE